MMLTARMCRRRKVTERVAHPNPSVMRMNGMPSPSEYASPSRAARAGSPRFHETEMIAARVGPMQGVQPMPSATPRSGAPMSPALPRTCGWTVRCANPNTPMKTSPSTMMTTPSTRVMISLYCRKNWPSVPPRIVTAMNTTVNPAMNSSTPSSRRDRVGAATSTVAELVEAGATPVAEPVEASERTATGFGRGWTAPPMKPR